VLVTQAELRDGRIEEIVSIHAPVDDPPLVRVPRLNVRPFQFEACVSLGPWAVTGELIKDDPESARFLTVGWAGVRSNSARVVMKNHWARYKAEHPDEPDPVSLTLVVRFVAKPAWGTARPETPTVADRPFVRWTNPFSPNPYYEAFDPVDELFIPATGDRR
jgi:hypothetical protein